ncbi:hypothetical protein N665_0532s0042 [Sinapis alba]|nr:hypothetical protein N665_0532s0042 [Sinapis alba]
MSIVSWNSQGLGRPQGLTIQRFREMRQNLFLEILFLMETKNVWNVLVDLQVWLGYDNVFTVDPKNIKMDVKFADKNVIDNLVQFVVWERISRWGCIRKEPWCIIGDFNEILSNGEKTGGPKRADASFKSFSAMLQTCRMDEISSKGDRFTWGGWRWKKWTQCCLDRSFGNEAWLSLFPGSNQTFLEKRGSDHRPVLLRFYASKEPFKDQFRFDKRFLRQPEVLQEIEKAWGGRNKFGPDKVDIKIGKCRVVLSRWKRKRNFNAKDKITLLQQRFEWFQSRDFPCRFMINMIRKELLHAYKEEDSFWKQKSRDKWLVLGDRSSKFFHGSVKTNRSRNHISKLKDKNNQDQFSDGAKAEVAVDYFTDLFKSSNPRPYDPAFERFPPKVTAVMNDSLI